jgi:hypothetical protein
VNEVEANLKEEKGLNFGPQMHDRLLDGRSNKLLCLVFPDLRKSQRMHIAGLVVSHATEYIDNLPSVGGEVVMD